MSGKATAGLIGLVLLIFGVPTLLYFRAGTKPPEFDTKVGLDQIAKPLEILASRPALPVNTTSQEGLLGNVGLVLVVDHPQGNTPPTGFTQLDAITQYRPSRDDLVTEPLTQILYEGKVSRDLKNGGAYLTFTADLTANQAAEVIVKDEVYIGYKDRSKIPYAELRKIKQQPGKSYFFVESATLTTITHKVYDALNLGAKITGSAFAANGNVYVSNSGFIFDAKLGITVFDLSYLQPQEGGAAPAISPLIRKPRLTTDESKQLLEILTQASTPSVQQQLRGTLNVAHRDEGSGQ